MCSMVPTRSLCLAPPPIRAAELASAKAAGFQRKLHEAAEAGKDAIIRRLALEFGAGGGCGVASRFDRSFGVFSTVNSAAVAKVGI